MGLFDFFSRRKRREAQEDAEFDELISRFPRPRPGHYLFSHVVLRQYAQDRPGECLGVLSDPEIADKLIGSLVDFVNEEQPDVRPLDASEIEIHRVAGEGEVCIIVQMPPPERITECYFVGLLFQVNEGTRFDEIREEHLTYWTLEYGISLENEEQRTVLGGWTRTAHQNYGDGPLPVPEEFARAIMGQRQAGT